jgi:hypothetical protein
MIPETGSARCAGRYVLCMNLRLARSVDIAMVAKAGGYDALYVRADTDRRLWCWSGAA